MQLIKIILSRSARLASRQADDSLRRINISIKKIGRWSSPPQASRFMSLDKMLELLDPFNSLSSVAEAFRFFKAEDGTISLSRALLRLVGDTRTPRTLFLIGSFFAAPLKATRAGEEWGEGDGEGVRVLRF